MKDKQKQPLLATTYGSGTSGDLRNQERMVPAKEAAESLRKSNYKFFMLGLLMSIPLFFVSDLISTELLILWESSHGPTPTPPDLSSCNQCKFQIVESIPEGLVYDNSTFMGMKTFDAWSHLIQKAESRVELASSYWSLRGKDVYEHPTDKDGEQIYKWISEMPSRNIKVTIAQNLQENKDTEDLAKIPGITVRSLNFTALMGNGILHTKLWVVDRKHFYVGSANFDWRSLTQVKEMGVLVTDCPCLAEDMGKIYDVYWALGGKNKAVPKTWPSSLETAINDKTPAKITNQKDNTDLSLYLSSSPPPFCPEGRTVDIEAIMKTIEEADRFVYIAVMDYFPATLYTKMVKFWPVIDDALRRAAIERGVQVRLLLSHWDHSRESLKNYLTSLTALNGIKTHRGHYARIEGKLFQVPAFTPDQAKIPFARVNHNKYMVTDKTGFIGTSNWSADYFINTGGIGFVFRSGDNKKQDLRTDLLAVFRRDWSSAYAHNI